MALLGILFELFGELLLEVFAELFLDLGLKRLAARPPKPKDPYVATVGYVAFGAVAGGLSLWLFPDLFIRSQGGQIANVVVTPILAGGFLAALGAWRRRRGADIVVVDRFAYGYLFALVMALVRWRLGG